jgi:hypothetical protein
MTEPSLLSAPHVTALLNWKVFVTPSVPTVSDDFPQSRQSVCGHRFRRSSSTGSETRAGGHPDDGRASDGFGR